MQPENTAGAALVVAHNATAAGNMAVAGSSSALRAAVGMHAQEAAGGNQVVDRLNSGPAADRLGTGYFRKAAARLRPQAPPKY